MLPTSRAEENLLPLPGDSAEAQPGMTLELHSRCSPGADGGSLTYGHLTAEVWPALKLGEPGGVSLIV